MFFSFSLQSYSLRLNPIHMQCPEISLNKERGRGNKILLRDLVAREQVFRRYCSRGFGKRVANEDSSVKGFWLSSLVKGSTFHCVYDVSYLLWLAVEGDIRGRCHLCPTVLAFCSVCSC